MTDPQYQLICNRFSEIINRLPNKESDSSVTKDAVELAGQLIAFIDVNSLARTFAKATHEEVTESLAPFRERLKELQQRL